MNLNPTETAVVVIDMQNDFCHPDGELYTQSSEEIIQTITNFVSNARQKGAKVVYTKDVHPETQFDDAHYYNEFEQWGKHVVAGTKGAEIHKEFDVRDDDFVVEKNTYDAFFDTQLDEWLTSRGIKNLIFMGTLTNVCVLHSAGSAGLRDYHPVIVEDAVGYIKEDHKDYSLKHADWLFGDVVSESEISL